MVRSTKEQPKNKLLLKALRAQDHEQAERRRPASALKPSIAAIPPPDPTVIFQSKVEKKVEVIEPVKETEKLCAELCNSYKFVVNNGVYEPNFEWLPCEVR